MPRSFYGRVGVDVEDSLSEGLDVLESVIRAAAAKAVLKAAEPIRQRAHDLANVSNREVGHARDGRHMRDCIDITVTETASGASARIGIDIGNVPYAAHQEFGPHGKPFLRPAIDEGRSEAHGAMAASLREDIGEALAARTAVRFRKFA